MVKTLVWNPPEMQEWQEMLETQVRSLRWEAPMEVEMATHSGILAWRILWTEEPGGIWSLGLQTVEQD